MIRDIRSLQKPRSALPAIKRAGEYVEAMARAGRAPSRVVLMRKDYDAILRSLQASRQPHEPEVSGLSYGDLPVGRE